MPRQLMLNRQVKLLNTHPRTIFGPSNQGAGWQRTGNNVLVSNDVVAGGVERIWRVAGSVLRLALAIAEIVEDAVPAADRGLAAPGRIKSKPKSRGEQARRLMSAPQWDPSDAALHQPIPKLIVDRKSVV